MGTRPMLQSMAYTVLPAATGEGAPQVWCLWTPRSTVSCSATASMAPIF